MGMIKIYDTYKEQFCSCCFTKNDVKKILFRSDIAMQGTVIALCVECRKLLRRLIKDEDGDPDTRKHTTSLKSDNRHNTVDRRKEGDKE